MNSITADKILIIIPAYNEERTIGAVIRSILSLTEFRNVLVINDGSFDRTSRTACTVGARVLELPYNLGIGAAVQTGYLFAEKERYEYVIRVDADGQHEVSQMCTLLAPLLAGEADMVIGSRYLSYGEYRSPLARRIGIKILAGFVSWIIESRITDATSGFIALNRNAVAILAESSPDEYPEVESIVLLHEKGLRVKEVGVKMGHRQEGRSSITALGSIYYMVRVILGLTIELLRRDSS
ncbi:MAG: glycosyltransferase family 2 protein [Candidatus Aureabacteria bacterium]|nr:glycosyltransferase family 2 protein [Candidatus Auribacterota bacterium]